MWSKDIIFVVADGYIDGMQAWLDAYHGNGQSSQCIIRGLPSLSK
jgi:glycosylphosphatidylinositol transamidase